MAKRAKKSKKSAQVDEDVSDHPRTVGQPIYYKVYPPVGGVYSAMSDAELERVRAYPSWVWGGLYDMGQRLLARLDVAEGTITRKTPKTSATVTSLD